MNEEDAMALLVESGLQLGNVTEKESDDENMNGLVTSQSEEPGTYVDKDTKIDVEIAKSGDTTYSYSGDIEAPTAYFLVPVMNSGTDVGISVILFVKVEALKLILKLKIPILAING